MKRSSKEASSMEEAEKKKVDRSSPQTPAATPARSVSESYEYKRRKKEIAPLTALSELDVLRTRGQQLSKSSSARKRLLEEYFARRKKILNSLFGTSSLSLVPSSFAGFKTGPRKFSERLVNKQVAGIGNQGVANLGHEDVTKKAYPIVVLDLDSDDEDLKVSSPVKGSKSDKLNEQLTTPSDQASNDVGGQAYPTMAVDLDDENSRYFCADQVHIGEKTFSPATLDLDNAVEESGALKVVNEQASHLLDHATKVDNKVPSCPIIDLDMDTDNEDLRQSSPAKGIKSEELNEQVTTLSDQASNDVGEQASPVMDMDLDDEDNENCMPYCAAEVVTVQATSFADHVHNTEKTSSEQVAPVIYASNSKNLGDLTSLPKEDVDMTQPTSELSRGNVLAEGYAEFDDALKKEATLEKGKGVYVGIDDDMAEEGRYHRNDAEDNLEDIWKEMTFAMECSKEVDVDPSCEEHVREIAEDCDHSFILKDDLGYVCRVCGIIKQGIETIFEFVYSKGKKSTRTYMTESQNRKHGESNKDLSPNPKFPEDDITVTEINAHPRHRKEMRAHQLEGFKFLQSNLFSDPPGGCILAHAPGSGKTFLIISFIQSFLAKDPAARPLIVLPKGILSTWKKEFQKWQVEDIPLLDFYTSKADGRSQQLDVLKSWVKEKSILFLGFKQVSSIICDRGSNDTTLQCQEILLKVPTILILDEGHTSRNDETDVFQSLAKVQTPRKVVLSGTLYQNHVKEVFNILNLVCPRFLRISREIHKRIMSRVQIDGVRKNLKGNSESAFFDLVEHALTKDENRTRTEAVIGDLREMTHKILHYYKGDFLEELPGLVDFTVVLKLSDKQKAEVPYLQKLERFKKISEGVAIYMHPNLKNAPGDLHSDDAKMDKMLKEMDPKHGVKMKFFLKLLRLCESAGEKLLVFSQYITPLKLLERLTVNSKGWTPGKEIFLLTGDTKFETRESFMDTFNNSPHAKVFFGSIKACGEGISLVGASRILILDVHLNPSVTRQAIGRAFRPGQKNKVYTYRLVAADSPEEDDHLTSFRKELVSKRWFEWNARCGHDDFELKTVDVNDCGDPFFENSPLGEDLKVLYRR